MARNYSTSVQESDIFEAIKRDVLIDLRDWLVERLSTDKIITYLRSKRILDQYDTEKIKAENTTIERNGRLLDVVDSKGSEGFDQLCHAIKERCTGQMFVLDKILIEFERRKQERMPKDLPPATYSRSVSSPAEDPKLVVMVTGMHDSHQVDLDNLPGPGDPGAPVPPDELSSNVAQAHPNNQSPSSPPPSYASVSPPPYAE